jgi:hypothetical protein
VAKQCKLRKVYYESIANYSYKKDVECDIRKPMEQAMLEMKHAIYEFQKSRRIFANEN